MKHRGECRWAFALFTAVVRWLFTGTALAITITEPPDHANSGNGTAHTLTLGTNSVSGTVTSPGDIQDRFQVAVPSGQQLTAVSWTFNVGNPAPSGQFATFNINNTRTNSGSFTGLPLSAGTYTVLINANFAPGNAWTMSFTTIASAVCGNGALEGSETCDTGNTVSGDGCSATCQTESGFSCSGATCSAICGDGLTLGAETCDDNNTGSTDGRDSLCALETGWTCSGTTTTTIRWTTTWIAAPPSRKIATVERMAMAARTSMMTAIRCWMRPTAASDRPRTPMASRTRMAAPTPTTMATACPTQTIAARAKRAWPSSVAAPPPP